MVAGSCLHTIALTTLPGTGITTDRMVTAGLPVSAITDVLRPEAPISPFSMESLTLKFSRAHGLRGGHIGIGMGMSSGGI